MTVHWTPRWRHTKIAVAAESTIRVRPVTFVNDTEWDWHLKWLSIAGVPVTETSVTILSQIEIGISQRGDINYQMANIHTLFGAHARPSYGVTSVHEFNPPYELPPDSGIVAEVHTTYATGLVNPTISFNGLRKEEYLERMAPAQLSSGAIVTVGQNDGISFDPIDLFNEGSEPFFIQQMVLSSNVSPYKSYESYRINPSTGVLWMPDLSPIPVGNIAPYSQEYSTIGDAGPVVYRFPQGTLIRPRQRMNIEFANLSTTKQTDVNLCLHGLLEVQ